MRTHIIILLFTSTFLSCDNRSTKEEILPRYISSSSRTCEADKAINFQTVAELLNDFRTTQFKDSFELNLRLGAFYYFKKNYDSSLFYYFKAKRICETDPNIHFNLAITYSDIDQYDKALNSVDSAIKLCGEKWDFLNNKCYVLGKLGRYEEAISFGQASYNLNPDNKKIYGNLLVCFDKLEMNDSIKKFIDLATVRFKLSDTDIVKLKGQYNYR